jgi:cyclase
MASPTPVGRAAVILATMAFGLASRGTAASVSVNTKERTVTQVADGVYVIRHPDAPDDFPQGNTIVIVGDREAFVVDACYLPSTAREDIAQIREWTDKPVRYLLNTHWHYDHTRGDASYAEVFPSLSVVAHAETRRSMELRDAQYPVRYAARHAALKAQIDAGTGADGKPLDAKARADLARTWDGQEAVLREYQGYVDRLPDVTFQKGLDVDLGGRVVQVRFLGRGNTAGDAVAYLPKEKVLVTGDLLVYPVPYAFGGYPSEWIATLEALAAFDAATIVPGHGEIQHDKAYLRRVISFLDDVVARVQDQVARNPGIKPEELKAAIDVAASRDAFAGDDADSRDLFDQSAAALVETSRREAVAR